jgi:hypothetical protein
MVSAGELRVGLTSNLEAEASWAPLIIDLQRGAANVTGTGDLTAGLRRALTTPGGDGAQASIQGYVTAPTATNGLGAGVWTGGARLPVQPLPMNLSLGLTPEVDVVRNVRAAGPTWPGRPQSASARRSARTPLGLKPGARSTTTRTPAPTRPAPTSPRPE